MMRFPAAVHPVWLLWLFSLSWLSACATDETLPPDAGPEPSEWSVEASLDTSVVQVGDDLVLTLAVRHPESGELVPPAAADLSPFEVLESARDEVSPYETRLRYRLAAYELPGELEVPALELSYRDAAGELAALRTEPIAVELVSSLSADQAEIHDIKEPVGLLVPRSTRALIWLLGGALAAALAYYLYRRWRRGPAKPVAIAPPAPLPSPDVEAEAALARLEDRRLIDKAELDAFYTELTEIMKRYAGRRYGVPYLERTTGEILSDLRDKRVSSRSLQPILDASDLVKFARERPASEDARSAFTAARELIRETRPRPESGACAHGGRLVTRFAYPWLLLLLALVPVLLYARHRWGHRSPTLRFSDLSPIARLPRSIWSRVAWLPFALRVLAVTALVLALARPQQGARGEQISAEGVDIMLVLDVSSSMLAEDFRPANRLGVAKDVVSDFIQRRENDRLGMTVFARHAITKTPLTLDHDILLTHLADVDVGTIEDGTAIGNAVASSVNRLKDSDAESRIMILLTDGENTAGEVDPVTAAQLAKTFGIRVYTVGVGRGGAVPYPFRDPLYGTVYRNVEIPIDEEVLGEIASITGARFFRARDAESLQAVYEEIDALERTEIEQIQYVRYTELAPWFMALAIGLLVGEAFLARTRLQRFP